MSDGLNKLEFKKSYPKIFSFFYGCQGMYNGLQAIVLPIYLITVVDTIDLALILIVLAIGTIPWALKFLIGMINDKYGSEKYGRRRPWIFIFGLWGGAWFIIAGLFLPTQLGLETVQLIMVVAFLALMWNIGWAIADTALDGLILDVTPKDKLAKVQSYTWSMNMLGSTALGIILGALVLMFDLFTFFFILEGILMIIACTLTFKIKESKINEEVKVWTEFKGIISKKKNLKLFILSILDNIPYAVVTLAFGLLIIIYWPTPLVEVEITSISIAAESIDLFIIFAMIGAIGGIGIMVGCFITGRISDKNRRSGVNFAHILYVPCVLACVLFSGAFFGGEIAIMLGIIMSILLGAGEGALTTSLQAVRGDLAKQYPDMKSTYYALVISCLNLGSTAGYAIAAGLLVLLQSFISDFWLIFLIMMLIMALIQMTAYGIFLTIPKSEYEFARQLEKNKKQSNGEGKNE